MLIPAEVVPHPLLYYRRESRLNSAEQKGAHGVGRTNVKSLTREPIPMQPKTYLSIVLPTMTPSSLIDNSYDKSITSTIHVTNTESALECKRQISDKVRTP